MGGLGENPEADRNERLRRLEGAVFPLIEANALRGWYSSAGRFSSKLANDGRISLFENRADRDELVSSIDIFPTVLRATGARMNRKDRSGAGRWTSGPICRTAIRSNVRSSSAPVSECEASHTTSPTSTIRRRPCSIGGQSRGDGNCC